MDTLRASSETTGNPSPPNSVSVRVILNPIITPIRASPPQFRHVISNVSNTIEHRRCPIFTKSPEPGESPTSMMSPEHQHFFK